MIHNGPEQEIKNGFVTIEAAERIRQANEVGKFQVKHAETYTSGKDIARRLKLAFQAWEQFKRDVGALADGVKVSDILDQIERELMEEMAGAPRMPQVEQATKKSQTKTH